MQDLTPFQEIFRLMLEQSGVSHRDLAEKCGFSHSLVRSMLIGNSKPNPDRIAKIADALGLQGPLLERFTDAAKRAKSHPDVSEDLDRLRREVPALQRRYQVVKGKLDELRARLVGAPGDTDQMVADELRGLSHDELIERILIQRRQILAMEAKH